MKHKATTEKGEDGSYSLEMDPYIFRFTHTYNRLQFKSELSVKKPSVTMSLCFLWGFFCQVKDDPGQLHTLKKASTFSSELHSWLKCHQGKKNR